MCSWHPSVQKNKKGGNTFKTPLFGKRMGDHPSKMTSFVGHGFSHKRDNKPYFKFYMNNTVLLTY
jgi:hypothetical protein